MLEPLSANLLIAATQTSTPGPTVVPQGHKCFFYARGLVSTSTGSATIQIQARGDDSGPWITIGTITLTLGTVEVSDGFQLDGS